MADEEREEGAESPGIGGISEGSWIKLTTAIIGALATILVAYFGFRQATEPSRLQISATQTAEARSVPADVAPVEATPVPVETKPVSATPDLSLRIEGPASVPLGETTFFTIVSENGVRAEWIIGGFQDNETIIVEDLQPAHQIYVEPTNPSAVGQSFTLVVTIFDGEGNSERAEKSFLVVE